MPSRIQPGSIGLRLLQHSRRTINHYAPTVRRSPDSALPTAWQEAVSEPLIWQMPGTPPDMSAPPASSQADADPFEGMTYRQAMQMPPRQHNPMPATVQRRTQQPPVSSAPSVPSAPQHDNRGDDDEEKVSPMLNRILQLHRQRDQDESDTPLVPAAPDPPSDPVKPASPPQTRTDDVSPPASAMHPVQRHRATRRGRQRSRLASEQTPLQRKQQREQARSQPSSPDATVPPLPRTLSDMLQSDGFDDVGDFDEPDSWLSEEPDFTDDRSLSSEELLPDLDPPPPTPIRPLQRRALLDSADSPTPHRPRARRGRRQSPSASQAQPPVRNTISRSEDSSSLPSLPGFDNTDFYDDSDDMDTIPLQPARDMTFPSQSEVKGFTPDDIMPQDMPFDEQVDTSPFVPIRSESMPSNPQSRVQRRPDSEQPADVALPDYDLPLLDDSQTYINTEPLLNDTPPPPIRRNRPETPLKSLFDVGRSALDPPAPPEPDTSAQQTQSPQTTRQDVVQAAFADQLDDSDTPEDDAPPVRRTFADDHDPDLSFAPPVQRRKRERPAHRPPVPPPPPVQRQHDSGPEDVLSDEPVIPEDDDTEKVTTVQDQSDNPAPPPVSRAPEGSVAADLLRALNLPLDSPVAGLEDNDHLTQPVQRAADPEQLSSNGQHRQPAPPQADSPRRQAIPLDQALMQNSNGTVNNSPPPVQRAEAPPQQSGIVTPASVSVPAMNPGDAQDSGESEDENDWNLDKLARDVYRQLRNRLRIEQERRSDRNG